MFFYFGKPALFYRERQLFYGRSLLFYFSGSLLNLFYMCVILEPNVTRMYYIFFRNELGL